MITTEIGGDERSSAVEIFPNDATAHVQTGTGIVCDGDRERHAETGNRDRRNELDCSVGADNSAERDPLSVTASPTAVEHESARTEVQYDHSTPQPRES
jgi:hypothetical protein